MLLDYGSLPDLGDSEVAQAGREEIAKPGFQLVAGCSMSSGHMLSGTEALPALSLWTNVARPCFLLEINPAKS